MKGSGGMAGEVEQCSFQDCRLAKFEALLRLDSGGDDLAEID